MKDATIAINGWERALMAAEKVKERLRRAVKALEGAGVPYAVAGGNAVAEWVGRVDEGAVRNTRDVDLLLRRTDFAVARAALEGVGFVYHRVMSVDTFIDGPDGKPSQAVHLVFAGKRVKPHDEHATPDVDASARTAEFQVAGLEALVRLELIAYRSKHKMHVRDLIDIGLIDATWPARFPPPLGERLQQLLDDPNG